MNRLALELLRDSWLIREDSLNTYGAYAYQYLLAELESKTVSQGLFGEIALPEVPSDIALITLSGPLTKADYCGSEGTRSLTNKVLAAAKDPAITGLLVYAESCPGGQVDGTPVLADAIAQARKKKPVVSAISGMTCSAGYWIQSQSDESWATSWTDSIGCIGVLARMKNPKKLAENEDFVTVYSDLSPDKNIESRDLQLYKEKHLNPVAEMFHDAVKKGRGSRLDLSKENVLSGATYLAEEATKYGMIEGVMPIHKIIARIGFLARTKKTQR